MAVIDLSSGRITQDTPDVAVQAPQVGAAPQTTVDVQAGIEPAQQPQDQPQAFGRVIDLNTGGFVQDQQADPARQAEVQAIDTERRRRIEELPELEGIAAGEDKLKLAALAPVLLTTTDPRELGNILSSNFS